MTMNRLPSRYIGLYIEQLEQGDLRVSFSSFFLVVIRHFGVHVSQLVSMGVNRGHWFSFENKTGRGTKKCFKEVTLSLKGWKKKFFLLDCHAISDAIPWRHGDTDLHDDFLTTYNGNDVARLSEFLDQDKNVISMDTFFKLPTWTGIVVSKGNPVLEDQPWEKKDQQNAARAEAKRVGAWAVGGPKKKWKVQKHNEPTQSGLEGTLSATP
ncbi:hypothetical protein Tco_1462021 [Tanacetum coccineum]